MNFERPGLLALDRNTSKLYAGRSMAAVSPPQTIGVIDRFNMVLEEIGVFKRGKAAEMSLKGETRLGGKIAVNTSGGLKARGHAPGATGIAQIIEVVQQLRGEAGDRQVEGAKIGMTENHGGTAATAVVHILEAE